MKIFYTDAFAIPLPEDHSFPIAKSTLLRKQITDSNLFSPQDLCISRRATDAEITRAHDPDYLDLFSSPKVVEVFGFHLESQKNIQ